MLVGNKKSSIFVNSIAIKNLFINLKKSVYEKITT